MFFARPGDENTPAIFDGASGWVESTPCSESESTTNDKSALGAIASSRNSARTFLIASSPRATLNAAPAGCVAGGAVATAGCVEGVDFDEAGVGANSNPAKRILPS